MKSLILVSTGRCGTKRISEMLTVLLKDKGIEVNHQRPFSRISNVLGNIMFYIGSIDLVKRLLFGIQFKRGKNGNIFTDPLTAMCLPGNIVADHEVHIIHIHRDDKAFAQSMYRLTRSRTASLFAHNFIPFWQPYLWPLENFINPNIRLKYEKMNQLKNKWFEARYKSNPNYRMVEMQTIFKEGFLNDLIKDIFELEINANQEILNIKSNQSS